MVNNESNDSILGHHNDDDDCGAEKVVVIDGDNSSGSHYAFDDSPAEMVIAESDESLQGNPPLDDDAIEMTHNMPLHPAITDEPETTNGLEEWRAIRRQQDLEYEQSLRTDQEKDQMRQEMSQYEERRLKIIEERLVRRTEEPAEGIPLKFTFPDGTIKIRRFQVSDEMQVLFDFVGSHNSATEYFSIREATSAISITNTISGTLLDHCFTSPSNIHVRWMDMVDVEANCLQQNPLLQTSDPSEANEVIQDDLVSNHSDVIQDDIMDPENETNYISIMPDIEQDDPELQDGSEIMVEVSPLQQLVSQCDFESSSTANMVNVCRSDIMNCALRAFGRGRFDPKKKISVIFMDDDGRGEGAVDDGGPLREFLRLLLTDIRRCQIFEGPENQKNLSLDVNALHTGLYKTIGKMIAVCLIHGGVAPHFFAERLYSRISGKPSGPATLSDVGDQLVYGRLKEIQDAQTIVQAREAILQASDILTVLGTMRHISSMEERDSLINHSVHQYVDGRVHSAYQEFMEGLSTLELAEAIQAHPEHFKGLFLENTKKITAQELIDLFQPVLSLVGSSRRREESRVLCYWRDWLIDIEEGECAQLQLEDILIFASGLSRIPPLGFPVQPSLEFLHPLSNTSKPLPEANTCSVVVRLPIHKTFSEFKFWMESGIIQSPTFGVA